jgi:hypothetical protein
MGRKTYLPMELCKTLLKSKKKLDEKQTANMIKLSANVSAEERMEFIETWKNNCQIRTDPILQQFNILVDEEMVRVDGRVLSAPDTQYYNIA